MSEAKRLHPISAVENFLKQLKEMLFPFVILFVFGGNGAGNDYWRFIVTGAALVVFLIVGILKWLRFTYRIEEGELRIESGVFVKKKRYIPLERIQSLDLSEGIFQRPFGLVKVKVETAGSSSLTEAEAVLTAITKAEAKSIQDMLASVKIGQTKQSEEVLGNKDILYRMTPAQLLLLASTSGGAGVVISAVVAFIFQFDEIIPYKKVFNEFQHFIANGVVFVSIIVLLVFLVAWLLSLIGTMMKYAHFTVQKVESDLMISRGLLEKRQLTIPMNRIQGIIICENLIRQPFGYATVYVESAGGSVEKEGSSNVMLLPIIKRKEIALLLNSFLPDYEFNPDVVSVPKRALKRYMLRSLIIPLLIMITTLIFWQPWGYLSFVLIPLAMIWAFLQYRDAGWSVKDLQLTLTFRGMIKNTVIMKKNKIQSISLKRSYFQKKKQLASVEAMIKSGIGSAGGSVVDIEEQDSIMIYNWYKHGV